jgi:hypothetical protein
VGGTWNVKYDDGSSTKIVVASNGSAIITGEELGVQVSGRLEPQTGSNASAWQFNIVDQQVATEITDFVSAGATRIQVSSAVGFEVGSEVVIDAGSIFEESMKIKGFGSILLETPTKFDHKVGATVSASSNAKQYRLKIQDGVLVVGRFAESTWVEGSGTLEVSQSEKSEFSIGVIVIVAAGVGLLGIVAASVLFCMCCRQRAPNKMAPTSSVHMKGQVSTNSEMEPPKLLGTLQGSSLTSSKKSRDALEACSHGVEISDVESADQIRQKRSREGHDCTHDVCVHITNDSGDEETAEWLSRRDIEAADEESSMPGNTFGSTIESL